MGMFDNIVCEYPLPDGFDPKGREFQTKSLGCDLDVYTITKEGRLVHSYREWEPIPEEERAEEDRNHPLGGIIGIIREKPGSQKLVDRNYHGFIRFYNGNVDGKKGNKISVSGKDRPFSREYVAKFTDGNVVSIEVIESNDYEDCVIISRDEFNKIREI